MWKCTEYCSRNTLLSFCLILLAVKITYSQNSEDIRVITNDKPVIFYSDSNATAVDSLYPIDWYDREWVRLSTDLPYSVRPIKCNEIHNGVCKIIYTCYMHFPRVDTLTGEILYEKNSDYKDTVITRYLKNQLGSQYYTIDEYIKTYYLGKSIQIEGSELYTDSSLQTISKDCNCGLFNVLEAQVLAKNKGLLKMVLYGNDDCSYLCSKEMLYWLPIEW